ncbi:hypothetical protein BDC45DRAFT_530001 [Circinella umbellata]|nr:hypothetical protein BDC45DRAFT_530001 [Circinella umbellata]
MTHYLQKLVSQDPGISRRDASIRSVNDSKIVHQHVVSGTVAETTPNSMCQYNKGSAVVIAESSVDFFVQKHRLRSSMAEQSTNKEEKITRKRRGAGEGSSSNAVLKRIKENKEREDGSDTAEVDESSCIMGELLSELPNDKLLIPEKFLNFEHVWQFYIYDDCNENILSESEASYRFYLFDVCPKPTTKYLRDNKINITFPSEIELVSMTTQLKQKGLNNGHYKCNADGIIKDN